MVEIEMRNAIPGRIRLKVKALYRNESVASQLRHYLEGLEGVRGLRANIRCASLVVQYDKKKLSAEQLLEKMRDFATSPFCSYATASASCVTEEVCSSCAAQPRDEKRKSWISKVASFALLSGYLVYILAKEYLFGIAVAQGPLSLLAAVSVVAALPLLKESWQQMVHEKRFTIQQFMSFTLLLAIGMGEAMTAFEVIYILRGGMLLEEYVAERSRKAIRNMLELSAKHAYVLVDGAEVEVPIKEIVCGDTVVVRTGEKIPVDGVVSEGKALLNEAPITGRSEPVAKSEEAKVYAGSYVEKGVLYITAEKVGEATYLARVLRMVEASLQTKAPIQNEADKLASRLLKLGTALTALTLAITRSFTRAFTVMLVMSCPCATILAASTAVTAAVYNAARRQILVKGGVYLEQIGEAKVFCFDKTGTLTTEEPIVSSVVTKKGGMGEAELFKWAASAELHNHHPLAHAITEYADRQAIEPFKDVVSEFAIGNGVRAEIEGSEVLVGNARMMEHYRIDTTYFRPKAKRLIEKGETVVYVAKDNLLCGVIGITHKLRPGVCETLGRLRTSGVEKLILITGDEDLVAKGLAEKLGFDAYHARLLPEEKADIIKQIQSGGEKVVMVGDGVNDALALTEADIGIAMGAGGSEVAIEVADIALAESKMEHLLYLRNLSRHTLHIVNQNYGLGTGTNLGGALLGAFGWLSPAAGGMIHIGHTLGIMGNSTRLVGFDGKK